MEVTRKHRPTPFVAATGNGELDFDVLSALGKKYDGKKILWFPKTPLPSYPMRDKRKQRYGRLVDFQCTM